MRMEAKETRIVAVDVETPNGRDAAICQIGIVFAEYGDIQKTESYLVDPEVPFDPVNISIHGITPADVIGAPNFPTLWPRIAAYFTDSVIVAHNAAFDRGQITKHASAAHLRESMEALKLELTAEDVKRVEAAFPAEQVKGTGMRAFVFRGGKMDL